MTPLDPRKLLEGDPRTAEAFLKYIRSHVRRYFRRGSQIHDVSQAAMLDVIARLEAGEEPEPDRLHYWVLNCAKNAVRRELTRLRHRAVSYESRLHCHPQASASAVLGAREEIERIDRLLTDCSEVGRKALAARLQGHTHREIAKQLDMESGAVRMTLTRLRATLSRRLSAEEKLKRLRLLAKRSGHQPSLFRRRPRPSSRS